MNAHEPRWFPDGKQILFTDFPSKIFVVPADGGAPKQLMPADHPGANRHGGVVARWQFHCFWAPHGMRSGRFALSAPKPSDLRTQSENPAGFQNPWFRRAGWRRLSRDGRYIAAVTTRLDKVMLYDFHTQRWSELVQGDGSITWSHDSKFVYLRLKQGTEPAKLVRVRVPDGKIEQVADLKDISLGGSWADWVSLLPDDSPLLMPKAPIKSIRSFETHNTHLRP